MNREILFRGKDKTGEWVYGDLTQNHGDIKARIEHYIRQNSGGELKFSSAVDPETVGQFTGLLDCNKKKIFEGDIVRDDHGDIDRIIFERGAFDCDWMLDRSTLGYEHEVLEVIGNIFDNPELKEAL